MNRWIQVFTVATIVLWMTATHVRANVVVILGSTSVAPGGTGTIDISITSNNNDTLSSFGLELQITPISATSILQFATTQPNPYLTPNYVFFGQSLGQELSLPLWAVPNNPPNPYVAITGGDSEDGSGLGYVTIPATAGGPNTYLASVAFQAAPGATLGDTFHVSLVNDPGFTYFDDQNNDPLTYSSGVGTVMIGALVPEPSSLTLMALSSFIGLVCYWRGRKSN